MVGPLTKSTFATNRAPAVPVQWHVLSAKHGAPREMRATRSQDRGTGVGDSGDDTIKAETLTDTCDNMTTDNHPPAAWTVTGEKMVGTAATVPPWRGFPWLTTAVLPGLRTAHFVLEQCAPYHGSYQAE